MSGEIKHKDPGVVDLTYSEYTAIDAHEADGQTANDMLYFNGTSWVRATPATILTLLTGQVAAAFSLNNQQLNAVKQIQYTAPIELTIADGVITVTQAFHTVDTQDNAASDDLDTINGGTAGMVLFLRAEHGDRTVVIKHNTGNIWLPGGLDISLDDIRDGILLLYDGTKWIGVEVAITAHLSAADPHTQYVLESLFDANTVLAATTDNTPVAITVGEQTVLGRVTAGNIAALTAAQLVDIIESATGVDKLDHGALQGLEDDDHPQYALDTDLAAHAEDTSTHGAADIADVSDIAVDANLSVAAQDAISKRHSQNTDTALGVLGTKNPPIDADKVIQRNSEASDALVTSTWAQIKAFLKTYFDSLYASGIGANLDGAMGLINLPSSNYGIYLDTATFYPLITDGTTPYPIIQGIIVDPAHTAWYIIN